MKTKKVERRIKIKYRIRKNVTGTAERPRLSVFRSNKQRLELFLQRRQRPQVSLQ